MDIGRMCMFPMRREQLLELHYQLPTDRFFKSLDADGHLNYTCDFMVNAGPSYPQIECGQWTVTLTVVDGVGDYGDPELSVAAAVHPKDKKLTSATPVSVHCKVRARKSRSYDHLLRIGPKGATKTSKPENQADLSDLMEDIRPSHSYGSKDQHILCSDRTVHVYLTFRIPSTTPTTQADIQRLRDQQVHDGVLQCADREFPIHRFLLATHSPVFAARFQNAMDEGPSTTMDVDDVSAETLAAMLEFVYSRAAVTADVTGGLLQLYSAAGRYGMAELRRECVRVLRERETGFPVFCFSGLHVEAEKQAVIAAVKSLGGQYIDSLTYEAGGTHLLIRAPTRNEKFLAFAAAGKWILHMQYIQDSLTAGHFLPEDMYEWGNVEKTCINTTAQESDLAMAACRWRRCVERTGQGAFADWKVVLVAEANRAKGYAAYARVLQAGGATLLTDKPPYSPFVSAATHLLRETKGSAMNAAELACFEDAGVACHGMDYLGRYLCQPHGDAAKAAKSRPAPQEEEELAPSAKHMRR
ncbi:uncharacterized protein LOC129582411 [Paramacrobiotus metropolitanus]|uniref:uncharacterized protein LOC129582411 n=1 Tax=Paramacrobiotus metropolitanus TaxID=2943436 RepID=UPI0024464F97|nr:uncharacterized protein LOC129582411 [Paramacrobiotus metropolitanus]